MANNNSNGSAQNSSKEKGRMAYKRRARDRYRCSIRMRNILRSRILADRYRFPGSSQGHPRNNTVLTQGVNK